MIAIARFRLLPAEGKVLFAYLVFDALVSAASSLLAYRHLRNTPLYHIATIICLGADTC